MSSESTAAVALCGPIGYAPFMDRSSQPKGAPRAFVGLRRTAALVFTATLVGLVVSLRLALIQTVDHGFLQLEDRSARHDVDQVASAIDRETNNLAVKMGDWCAWDDAYNFMVDHNTKFVDSNLTDNAMLEMNLEAVVFYDLQGRAVQSKGYDTLAKKAAPLDAELVSLVRAHPELVAHKPDVEPKWCHKGLVVLPHRIAWLATRAIVNSEGHGPVHGTLLFMRVVDAEELKKLRQTTHLMFDLKSPEAADTALEQRLLRESQASADGIAVARLSETQARGWQVLKDLLGRPALCLDVRVPRDVYAQGRHSMQLFLALLLGAGLVFGLVGLTLTERLVLSRLLSVGQQVARIGHEHDLSARVVVAGQDEVAALAETLNDMLAELEQAQEHLRASREQYRAIVEDQTELICRFGPDHRLSFANGAACRAFGRDAEELLGTAFEELTLAADREEVATALASLGRAQRVTSIEVRAPASDGTRWLSWRVRALCDCEAANAEYQAVGRDITDRVRAEQAVREARDAAEAASRAKSAFLASMSHELRTPLNAVMGFSQMLEEQIFGPLNDKQMRYVGNILSSASHLLRLINDILDLSKVEAGKLELDLSWCDARATLTNVTELVKGLATKGGVTLELDLDDCPEVLFVDEAKLKQIMYNLLSNAIKFTPRSGWVKVATSATSLHGQPALQVQVADSGIGLAAEDLGRIFEEFVQVDSSYARQFEGTGLGLALTRRLVELHGGELSATSEGPDRGSTFTFVIPREVGVQPPPLLEPVAPLAVDGAGGLVLVIEDDAPAREMLGESLGAAGYEVLCIADGEEALKLVAERRPCAVLLDINLPGRSGWQVLADLKSDAATRDVPVVILSVAAERARGLSLGAVEYLVKPVDRHRLLDVLHRYERPQATTRALVVDDEPLVRELVSDLLRSHGWAVTLAATGEEGLRSATADPPDVMVLDLVLPGLTGFEVVEQLRATPATREVPVIIYTARELEPSERERLLASVDSIAAKAEGTTLLLSELRRVRGQEESHG